MFPLVTIDDGLWALDSDIRMIAPSRLPEPFRHLLAHHHHMTVTVEAHHHDTVDVTILDVKRERDWYAREIVLHRRRDGRRVQYGIVRIDLSCCAQPVREAILTGTVPLGRVLIDHGVLRRIEPTAFIAISPGPKLCEALQLATPTMLYGRTGVIFCDDRPAIAVLEILAPDDVTRPT